ncbi:MAG: hypothetical protein ACXU9O_11965 [Gemmatimonadaceae bacterium]
MTYDLTKFDLGDMLKCSLRLREALVGAPSLEVSAHRTCRFLYEELQGPDAPHACALVRCYKTHAFGALEPELQSFVRGVLGSETPRPTMKCLTLMATAGESASWNSRHLSRGHRAIPLPSPEIVEKAPMIAQLIKELGMELKTVLQPSPELVKELAGKRHGIFHVENALGSPYIPAQEDFVVRYGIKSVLGFGGMLFTGDLFAVILFSTVRVPATAADRFKTIALDVKAAFSRFNEETVFNKSVLSTVGGARAQ